MIQKNISLVTVTLTFNFKISKLLFALLTTKKKKKKKRTIKGYGSTATFCPYQHNRAHFNQVGKVYKSEKNQMTKCHEKEYL